MRKRLKLCGKGDLIERLIMAYKSLQIMEEKIKEFEKAGRKLKRLRE
jgi:hypothetical protein